MNPETMRDWVAYAKSLTNEEIIQLTTALSNIQVNRADDRRRAAAKKVEEAITEYLALGEEITICGGVYNENWGGDEEINAVFDSYENHDGYLVFNFAQ